MDVKRKMIYPENWLNAGAKINMKSIILKIIAFFLIGSVGFSAADAGEIGFDHGGSELSTVIGLYTPEGLSYILATDFSIMSPEVAAETVIRIHAHVGKDIQALDREKEPAIAVRLNGGAWHWESLAPYSDGGRHWIEISVPVDEWKTGLNRVEVNSNIANPSNQTAESIDLLGCVSQPIYRRSSFSINNGKTHSILTDRNWGIRLQMKERTRSNPAPVRLELHSEKEKAIVNEPVQYIIQAFNSANEALSLSDVQWSAKGGSVDAWGLFYPSRTGDTLVTAKSGGLSAELKGEAYMKVPAGIEPPGSPSRLTFNPPDGHITLNGEWDFRLDPDDQGISDCWYKPQSDLEWSRITVPGTWQAQGYGIKYHGAAWYRRALPAPENWADKNKWIMFNGAATLATVWLNGEKIGEHTGNWAPFTLSLADHWSAGGENVLVVRVEELPYHFSAGFSREIGRMAGSDSHFGGLWQDVTIFGTGALMIDDLYAFPRLAEEKVLVKAALRHHRNTSSAVKVVCTIIGPDGKNIVTHKENIPLEPFVKKVWSETKELEVNLSIPKPRLWSPDSPDLYKVILEAYSEGALSDRRETRFGMRSVECRGTQILLNGKPLMVRGVLHWGYYPDLFNIDPSEDRIRREFNDLRAAGFNMVKVCLFYFPRRFYEIADETGMLLWQEYPTWLYVNFPQAGDTRLDADFAREYPEWFRFDRRYTSIILRDLTCEAHINPNFDLLERTYKVGKRMLDNALLCDNSSFFKHRITDWYVCHTYRDLDDYYSYLSELVDQMRSRPERKPFLFGEDFDADTYRDSEAIRKMFIKEETPWWLDNMNFEGQLQFDAELRQIYGPEAPQRLVEMQKKHAFALRKAYIEEFRRYPEPAGFIMTSLRDTTVTRPGFYDDLGKPKWRPEEWKTFNAERVLGLYMERRSHCFQSDELISGKLYLSNYGEDIENETVFWSLRHSDEILAHGREKIIIEKGGIYTLAPLKIKLPKRFAGTTAPVTCRLEAELGKGENITRNSWPVWIFPTDTKAKMASGIITYIYSPDGSRKLAAKYPNISMIPIHPSENEDNIWIEEDSGKNVDLYKNNTVLLSDTLDKKLLATANAGACIIYLAADDESGAIPRRNNPFWRETAIWIPQETVMGDFPHEGFVDLQFLDMTQRKPFRRDPSMANRKSWIWGISARNPGQSPFDYIMEIPRDEGSMLACCLRLSGETNIAGTHLLRCLIQYAADTAAQSSESISN